MLNIDIIPLINEITTESIKIGIVIGFVTGGTAILLSEGINKILQLFKS